MSFSIGTVYSKPWFWRKVMRTSDMSIVINLSKKVGNVGVFVALFLCPSVSFFRFLFDECTHFFWQQFCHCPITRIVRNDIIVHSWISYFVLINSIYSIVHYVLRPRFVRVVNGESPFVQTEKLNRN